MQSSIHSALTDSDVVVAGSGSAGLATALTAAIGGLQVTILEKTEWLGGTSAMSGAGTWVPANHHARRAEIVDSSEDALAYLRTASPAGWQIEEDKLWRAFVTAAPRMLELLEAHTPLQFSLTNEPDPMAELHGGKIAGRMLSTRPLRRRLVRGYAKKIRRSTLPHLLTYHEVYDADAYHRPVRTCLKLAPRLLWRLLTDSRGQGSALVTGLMKGCLDHGCRIETGARATELIVDQDGARIAGVIVEQRGERRIFAAKRGVVLATGGFEWDPSLVERHFPGPLDWTASPRANEGDGQRLALSVGAALARMDQANIYPCLPTRYEGKLHGLPIIFQAEPHAILVDRNGRRFVSEYNFNIGEALDRRDSRTGEPIHLPAWVIADCRFIRRALPFRWYARKDPKWLIRARTLDELAARTGLPVVALTSTIARFNMFCAQGRDLDFHRGESIWECFKAGGSSAALGSIEHPPFFAMPLNRSILGTKGGARTNELGQVVRPDQSIIVGLYAAGLTMANPIGTRAIGAGTTIGPNLTWGFICGEALLKDNR
jgi:3-oxosteroid 1-dehydrogenase